MPDEINPHTSTELARSQPIYRITETVRYEVAAPTEEDAERLFQEHSVLDVEEPVQFLGIEDRDVIEYRNARGDLVVVCPPR